MEVRGVGWWDEMKGIRRWWDGMKGRGGWWDEVERGEMEDGGAERRG